MARRRHRTLADRICLHGPLGRYWFTVLAILAFTTDLFWPCVVTTAIAIYAWKNR